MFKGDNIFFVLEPLREFFKKPFCFQIKTITPPRVNQICTFCNKNKAYYLIVNLYNDEDLGYECVIQAFEIFFSILRNKLKQVI